jgi:PIN domain nuclease of toxin-antitoxin system
VSAEALVADTHPLLHYFCGAEKKLSKKVKRAFDDAVQNQTTTIYVPSVVVWEVSMLVHDGDIKLTVPFADWIQELFEYPTIVSHHFDENTVVQYHHIRFHADPFDKAIVAAALQLGLPLITNDSVMHRKKPCRLFWD